MARWPKPAEGSWTEHYPELGTGPISFRDSTSPEFYELEREAIFKRAWLNVGRVERSAAGGQLLHQGDRGGDARRSSWSRATTSEIRAFHNVCRHRGNKLVWNDFPHEETRGTCRQFTCKYHGWRYDLDGALTFVQQEREFFDLDKADYGLCPVHCDVWNGFIFINFDRRAAPGRCASSSARWSPRSTTTRSTSSPNATISSPTTTATGRSSPTRSRSTTTCPSLHPQQVPAAVRDPNAGFECAHFQLDGPHRWCRPRAPAAGCWRRSTCTRSNGRTHSGLVGPWRTPDIGELPAGSTPAASSRGGSATSRSSRTSRS